MADVGMLKLLGATSIANKLTDVATPSAFVDVTVQQDPHPMEFQPVTAGAPATKG